MRSAPDACIAVLAAALAGSSWGQAQPDAVFRARADSSLLVSDNLGSAPGVKDGGAVLTLTPGLLFVRRSSDLDVSVDYGARLIKPWRVQQDIDSLQHTLSANARLGGEGAPFRLIGMATAGQQTQSAFGQLRALAVNAPTPQQNQRQVATLSLAPSLRLRLGGQANFEASHRDQITRVKDSLAGDGVLQDDSVSLASATEGRLGWRLSATRTRNRPKLGQEARTDRNVLALTWRPDIDWQLTANGGSERSNLQSGSTRNGATYGLGANWSPTPRTQFSAGADEHVYGNTHRFSLNHRFSRVSFTLSDSRSVNQGGVFGAAGTRTNYELLFAQLTTAEPDPVRRDLLVRQQLALLGLNPDATSTQGVLAGSPSLSRQRLLGATWLLPRGALNFSASQTRTSRLGLASGVVDDFARTGVVDQKGLNLGYSHRLTEASSLNTQLQWQRNGGDTADLRVQLKSLSVTWTTQLGQREQLGLTLRHAEFASQRNPYDENALMLTFQHQF